MMMTMDRTPPHSPHTSPYSHASHTPHGEAGGYTTSAKQKLDELFVTWLSFSDTSSFISSIISSFKQSSPASPTSPLDSPTLHDATSSSSFGSSPRKYSPRKYNRAYARSPVSTDDHAPSSPLTTRTPLSLSLSASPNTPQSQTQSQSQPQPKLKAKDNYETVPRFYFPNTQHPPLATDDIALAKISAGFGSTRVLSLQEALGILCEAAPGLPQVVGRYLLLKEADSKVSDDTLLKLWRLCCDKRDISGRDAAGVIFEVLRQAHATTLQPADLRPFMRLVLDSHPGLSFLSNTPEFQERYLETTLVRVFYNSPRGVTGKMDLGQLRKSGLVAALNFIDNETDINKSINFFSYEHFYVIYCKFWEVDTDHDLIISAEDLLRYSGGPPTRRVAERIASTPIFPRDPDLARVLASKQRRQRGSKKIGLMTYQDFVWFILSEEDRDSAAAMEYWFRMLDVDEDGVWSSFELEYFYSDMQPYLRELGMDPPPFEDLLCQWLDMLSPHYAGGTTAWDCPRVEITANDLRKSKLGKAIIHSLVSPSKFVALETKDPFAEPRDGVSDWVRFALVEYELAVADQTEQLNPPSDEE